MKILVTGAKGQLGLCIRDLALQLPKMEFIFTDLEKLDIVDAVAINAFFEIHNFQYCINCAAYTAVDKAEEDEDLCFKINADGPSNLAKACLAFGSTMVHISTDFVFDGTKPHPYDEKDVASPISVYGKSKLKGEKFVEAILENYYIIRTSWVYSEHGNNFVKTMLRLGRERSRISVVNDQIGSPTYARDLAAFILHIVKNDQKKYGLYNYSNDGAISWFDFATAIFKNSDIDIKVSPISSEGYPTPAKRPNNSTLIKEKAINTFQIKIPLWSDSLKRCLQNINSTL